MLFAKFVNSLLKIFSPVAYWVNSAGAGILAAMMFMTAADVSLRYLFNKPIFGSYELSEFMMGFVVASTIAYAALQKAHVNVDLVSSRLPQKAQAGLSIVTNLLALAFFVAIAWRTFFHVGVSFRAMDESPALALPIYPFILITAIGFTLLSFAFFIILLESITKVAGKWTR